MSVALVLFLIFTAAKLIATVVLLRRPKGRAIRRRVTGAIGGFFSTMLGT